MDAVRVDSWLWAVRLYKTRAAAKDAISGGHVRVNGSGVKPAHRVRSGDHISATVGQRVRVVEVVEVIDKRVGAVRAAECYVDHSPPPPPRRYAAPAGRRDRGSGRPTKKDRRQTDRLRGR